MARPSFGNRRSPARKAAEQRESVIVVPERGLPMTAGQRMMRELESMTPAQRAAKWKETAGSIDTAPIERAASKPRSDKAAFYAKGHLPPGVMNKTEEQYAALLRSREIAGEVTWWKYEPMRLWMGSKMAGYRVDFVVQLADREVQVHEIKGGFITREGYRLWRMAAAQFPIYHFFMYQLRSKKDGGGWAVADYDIPNSASALKIG